MPACSIGSMNRNVEEQRVLDKLGIKDFRHMTKEKIVAFASELPNMDPQVAIEAIRQFPEFAKTSLQLVETLQNSMSEVLDNAKESQRPVYEQCSALLDSLRAQLMQPHLAMEDHDHIVEQIMKVIELMRDMDREHKQFLLNIAHTIGGVVLGAATIAATVLGVKSIRK